MICIVCKSEFLAADIRAICLSHVNETIKILPQSLLLHTLTNEDVRLVFFDSSLFTDTASFRKKALILNLLLFLLSGMKVLQKKLLSAAPRIFYYAHLRKKELQSAYEVLL